MQIVILAAGKGVRMLPVTKEVPKPMILLKGKPKLHWTMEMLPKEIDEVIFVIGYLGQQIRDYFGDFFNGKKISYIHQEELNGTGGALHVCKDFLDDKFLVMMGDDLYHKDDIQDIMKHEIAILVHEIEGPSRFGSILTDEKGNFSGIIENKRLCSESDGSLVNTALYCLDKTFFDHELVLVSDDEFGLPQTMVKMTDSREIKILKARKWVPLGNVEDIAVAERELEGFLRA